MTPRLTTDETREAIAEIIADARQHGYARTNFHTSATITFKDTGHTETGPGYLLTINWRPRDQPPKWINAWLGNDPETIRKRYANLRAKHLHNEHAPQAQDFTRRAPK